MCQGSLILLVMSTIQSAMATSQKVYQSCSMLRLVEGKDRPVEFGLKEFEDRGKTLGLMVHMSQNWWNTGKDVTMDSGFSVSKGILAMREKGVFGQALIKP